MKADDRYFGGFRQYYGCPLDDCRDRPNCAASGDCVALHRPGCGILHCDGCAEVPS